MENIKGEIAKIKLSILGPDSLNIEIHSKDIVHGVGYYRSITQQMRIDLLNELFKYLDSLQCTVISIVVKNKYPSEYSDHKDKGKWYASKANRDQADSVESDVITYMMGRLSLFLMNHNPSENMLIAIDETEWSHDRRLANHVKEEIIKGVYTSRYSSASRIINKPLFLNSRDYSALQLSDLIAYTIFKKYSGNIKSGIFDFEPYYSIVEKKFDRNRHGDVMGYGLKIF